MHIQVSRLKFVLLICSLLTIPVSLFAQGTPHTVGPMSVTIPAGWTEKTALPGERVRFFSPDSTTQRYFFLAFSSPQTTEDDVYTRHVRTTENLSGLLAPGAKPESGLFGEFIWTRLAIQRPIPGSKPEILILYSSKVGSLYISVDVDANNEDLVAKNLPAVEDMLRAAIFKRVPKAGAPPASSAPPPYPPTGGARGNDPQPHSLPPIPMQPFDSAPSADGNFAAQAQMPTGPASISQYVYAVPPGWATQRHTETVALVSQPSSTGEQCIIEMWPMRPASGNLTEDAVSGFQQAFNGFEPRNQSSDGMPIQPLLIRGTSGAGWDYVIIKQGVGRHGPYQTLMGSAMAAKLNNTVAIVSTLSKVPLVSSCLGELISDAWPKFFYGLGFKSWVPVDQSAAMKRALAGTWTAATSTASDQFTFGPNGRYGGASGAQNYNLLANGTVQTTTQAFFGDGAYSLQGNRIAFTPDDRGRPPSTGLLRIEHESKDSGRTWTPVLYLLRISIVDGKEYEVRYKKTG